MSDDEGNSVALNDSNERLPPGMSGQAMLCVPGCGLYVIGGWNPHIDDRSGSFDAHYVREVWKFLFWSRKWKKLRSESTTAPVSLASHSAFLLNKKKFMIYGGSLSALQVACIDNKCSVYSTSVEQWLELACEGSLPPHAVGHWFGVNAVHDPANDVIYVATGVNLASSVTLIHKLDLQTWRWEKLSRLTLDEDENEPECRVRGAMLLHGNNLYLLGGTESFGHIIHFDTCILPTFSLNSGKWSKTSVEPDSEHGHPGRLSFFAHCCVDNDFVYVHGGCDQRNMAMCEEKLWRLNMKHMKWALIHTKTPLTPRWFHTMVYNPDDSCIYIYGGCTRRDYNQQRIYLLERVRVQVHTLTSICLETICRHRNYNIGGVESLKEWQKAGIPKTILGERLDF